MFYNKVFDREVRAYAYITRTLNNISKHMEMHEKII